MQYIYIYIYIYNIYTYIYYIYIYIPFVCFRLFSTGLKCIVGIAQTNCIGLGSIKQLDFLSQPAPSRKRPRIQTPSCVVNEEMNESINE